MRNETLRHLAIEKLKAIFRRNGYIRVPIEARRKMQGRKYKKGYEVRLVAEEQEELDDIRIALTRIGLKPGKPFAKGSRTIQPVYGKEAVDFFKAMISK